jgi:hypothetical protein
VGQRCRRHWRGERPSGRGTGSGRRRKSTGRVARRARNCHRCSASSPIASGGHRSVGLRQLASGNVGSNSSTGFRDGPSTAGDTYDATAPGDGRRAVSLSFDGSPGADMSTAGSGTGPTLSFEQTATHRPEASSHSSTPFGAAPCRRSAAVTKRPSRPAHTEPPKSRRRCPSERRPGK